jgi:hypothetical protein
MASTKKIIQKAFIVASGLAFLGTMTIPMMTIFKGERENTSQTQANAPGQPTKAEIDKTKAIAAGYEKVLEREPNNPSALQGLVEARLKIGDLAGAIAPMEKLTKIYPEEKGLKQLLEAIKLQVENPDTPPPKNPITPDADKKDSGKDSPPPAPGQP